MPEPQATTQADRRTIELPALSLRADVLPKSINDDQRTVELVFSTGAAVRRFDWRTGEYFLEKLSLDPAHVRLDRLNTGAPLLNTHSGWDLSSVLGVVQDGSATVNGKRGTATVRFSRRSDVEPFYQDVRDGVIRKVSVGYVVHGYQETPAKGDRLAVRTATDWEPYEISMVPMPADNGAQTRGVEPKGQTFPCTISVRAADATEELPMSEQQQNQPAETIVERNPLDPGAPIAPAATRTEAATDPNDRDRGVEAERKRVNGIRNACSSARMTRDFEQRLIDDGISLEEAQSRVFTELKARGYDNAGPGNGPTGQRVEPGVDHMIHVRAGIENALLHRVRPEKFELTDVGRRYRGMTWMDTGRAYLQAAGMRVTDMTPNQLAGAALGLDQRFGGLHTTSDFPLLLADVSNKLLRAAYAEAPQTFKMLARRVTIANYRYVNRLQLGDAPALLEIKEHGEYKSGSISEGSERYRLTKYGRKFGITREAIINDDLQALSDIPQLFGRKARAKESDLVWEQITSNPTMGDSNPLFSIAHGNLATTDGAIAIGTLGAGRAAMLQQTGLDGEYLSIAAKFLLVPPALETLADQYVTVVTPQVSSNVNPFQGRLTVISEPRLTDASEWYLAADPSMIPWLEYAYLEGEEGPQVESRLGFDIDGVEFKCRLDFAAKVIDWRGIYKNEGSTGV